MKEQVVVYKDLLTNAFNQTVLGREIPKDFKASLSKATGENGGFLVPEDLKGDIEEAKKYNKAISQFVHVIPGKTSKGYYTTESEANYGELQEINDSTNIAEENLKVIGFNWELKKYGSFTALSEELNDDTDFNLFKWFKNTHAEKATKTENKVIFSTVKASLATKQIASVAELKTSLNKDFNPALENEILIVTNQDGLEKAESFIEVLKGENEDPKRYLDVYRVEVYSNDDLPTIIDATNGDRVPFIYGSFKRSVKMFTDDKVEAKFVKNPFGIEKPNHVMRGIERFDVQVVPGTTQLIYAEMPLV